MMAPARSPLTPGGAFEVPFAVATVTVCAAPEEARATVGAGIYIGAVKSAASVLVRSLPITILSL